MSSALHRARALVSDNRAVRAGVARWQQLAQRLTPRQRQLLRAGGYSTFGVVAFCLAFSASLPRERIRDRLERELSQDPGPGAPAGLGMDVTIGELALSIIPPGVGVKEVTLKSRPALGAPPEEKPLKSFIDSLEVRPAVLGLLVGRRGGALELRGFRGEASLSGSLKPTAPPKTDAKAPEPAPGARPAVYYAAEASAKVEGVALALVPWVVKAVPLPLAGTLDLTGDLSGTLDGRTMNPQPTTLAGLIDLTINGCVLGNGKAMLKVPGDPFLSQGLTFPRVELGRVTGKIRVASGRVTLEGVHAKSADAEAMIDGYVDLREPLQFSEMHLYLRLKPSAALSARESKIGMLETALMLGKRADGFLGLSIQGTGAAPQARPAKDPPAGVNVRAAAPTPEPAQRMGAVRAEPTGLAALPPAVAPAIAPTIAPPPPTAPVYRAPPPPPPPAETFRPPPPAPVMPPGESPAPASAALPSPPPSVTSPPPASALPSTPELPPPPPPPPPSGPPGPPGGPPGGPPSQEDPPHNLPSNQRGE